MRIPRQSENSTGELLRRLEYGKWLAMLSILPPESEKMLGTVELG